MNITRLLGVLTFALGASVLASELLLGPELLADVTGTQIASLRFACIVAVVLGVAAVCVGMWEEREFHHYKEGK